jgi:hypothetical protein
MERAMAIVEMIKARTNHVVVFILIDSLTPLAKAGNAVMTKPTIPTTWNAVAETNLCRLVPVKDPGFSICLTI